jgi:hypothetical protein
LILAGGLVARDAGRRYFERVTGIRS